MFSNAIPGALAYAGSGFTASQVTAIGNGGGAGPVVSLSGNLSTTATANGTMYTNGSSVLATTTVTIPAGLANGTTFTFTNTNGPANQIAATCTEFIQLATAIGNTIATNAWGGSFTLKRADGKWMVIALVGGVANPV